MRILYFAYGSNLKQAQLRRRIGSFRVVGRALLAGHRLVFDKPGADGSAKANLRPAEGAEVWGVLYELEPDGFRRLDPFEGGYERIRVEVCRDDGSKTGAWTYLFQSPAAVTDAPPPFDWYRDLLLEGGREHGLPEAHLRIIASVAASRDARRGAGG